MHHHRAPLLLDPAAPQLLPRLRNLRLVAFDFDGVFTSNTVYVLEDGREMVRCSRFDGIGLSRLRQAGLHTVIISTETNPVVQARARKLNTPCHHGCEDKVKVLDQVLAEHGISRDQAAFVGNDVNDLGCFGIVGLAIAVSDAHPDVLGAVHCRTRLAGGLGAVREVCDVLCKHPVKAAGA